MLRILSFILLLISVPAQAAFFDLHVDGTWNAATNSPRILDGKGQYGSVYQVTTAGTSCVDGTCSWAVGDLIYFSLNDKWNKLTGTVNLTFTPTGTGAVTRTIPDRLRDSVSVFDFMTPTEIADIVNRTGTVDVADDLQKAVTAIAAQGKKAYAPAGFYKLGHHITFTDTAWLDGDGWKELPYSGEPFGGPYTPFNPTASRGTVFYLEYQAAHDLYGFLVVGSHVHLSNFEFLTNQPTPGPGWTPNVAPTAIEAYANPYEEAGGHRLTVDNIMCRNCYDFIGGKNARGGDFNNLYGQIFDVAFNWDGDTELGHGTNWKFGWVFWSGQTDVLAYQQAHAIGLQMGRVDGFQFSNLFFYNQHFGIHGYFSDNPIIDYAGPPNQVQFSNLSIDNTSTCLFVEGGGSFLINGFYCDNSIGGANSFSVDNEPNLNGSPALYKGPLELNITNGTVLHSSGSAFLFNNGNVSYPGTVSLTSVRIKSFDDAASGASAITANAGVTVKSTGLVMEQTGPLFSGTGTLISDAETTGISLSTYGYKPDNSTNNTAAIEAAIDAANTAGGNITFIVQAGTGLIGDATSHPITAGNVYFKCEGAPGACVFKGTATGGMLKWGDTTHIPDGGGLLGMGLDGNGNVAQLLVNLYYAARMSFNDIVLSSGVAQFIKLGTDPGHFAAEVYIYNLRGVVADVAAPLINMIAGAGGFIDNADVFTPAAPGASVTGRFFVSMSGSWDTFNINRSTVQRFDKPLAVFAVASGDVEQNISVTGKTWFDTNNGGPEFITGDAGATVSGINISDSELTAWNDSCLKFDGPGTFSDISIVNNQIRICAAFGIQVVNNIDTFTFNDNRIYGVNTAGLGGGGLVFAGTTTNGTIVGNVINDLPSSSTGRQQFAGLIPTGDHLVIANNRGEGSSYNWSIGGTSALTHSVVTNNPDIASVASTVTVGSSPATVCAGAQPETHYYLQSATNTATVALGSITTGTMSSATIPLTVNLAPNECDVVTWATTAPTYTKVIH